MLPIPAACSSAAGAVLYCHNDLAVEIVPHQQFVLRFSSGYRPLDRSVHNPHRGIFFHVGEVVANIKPCRVPCTYAHRRTRRPQHLIWIVQMPKLTEFRYRTVIQCWGVRRHAVYFLETRLQDTFLLLEIHCAIEMRISPVCLTNFFL